MVKSPGLEFVRDGLKKAAIIAYERVLNVMKLILRNKMYMFYFYLLIPLFYES